MSTQTLSPEVKLFRDSQRRPIPRRMRNFTLGLHTIELWLERAKQRRALLELDERLLRDIGVTRVQAIAEAQKPFWKS